MKCHWCKNEKDDNYGKYREGYWVCLTCFPGGAKNLVELRKCAQCGRKTNKGGVIINNFICNKCCSFFDADGQRKKNKYPTHAPEISFKEPKHKRKKNKPKWPKGTKKREYFTVTIEDISDGNL